MARVSAEERRDALTILPLEGTFDDDVGDAFNNWRASFTDTETPGTVRAFEIPLDERGNPQATAKNQVRLGAWPIDLYDFDKLCGMLMAQFMKPGQTMAVRFMGTKSGEAGIQFNKIVILRTPEKSETPAGNGNGGESLTAIMQAINANNERMMQSFRAMLPAAPQKDPMEEMQKMLAFSQMINAPNSKLMELLIPALVGRPMPAAAAPVDSFAQLSGMVDVFAKLKDLQGGGGDGESGGGDDGIVGIIKALAPIAAPALQAIPAIMARNAQQQQQQPRALAGPAPAGAAPPRAAPPGSAPTQLNRAPPAAPPATATMADIPSGDAEMFAQLKPQIDALVAMAAQGSDPAGAADILFDEVVMQLPDEYYEKLADLIGGADFVTKAAVFNPGVNAHREWFVAFAAGVVARYEAEDMAAQTAPTLPAAGG